MLARVTIRAADRDPSERFYATVLAALGVAPRSASGGATEWGELAVAAAAPAGSGPTRRLHVGLAAASREQVDAFWQAGIAAGYRDDGGPGPRPRYRDDYYGGFLLDPAGNSVEAVHHGATRAPGAVDHVWLRVADLDASARFYARLAAAAGLARRETGPELARFGGPGGSLTLIADGPPSENVDLALSPQRPHPGSAPTLDPDRNRVALLRTEDSEGSTSA